MILDGEPQDDLTSEILDEHGLPKPIERTEDDQPQRKQRPSRLGRKLEPGGLRSQDASQDRARWQYADQFILALREIELGSEPDRPVVLQEIRDTVLPLYSNYLLTGREEKEWQTVLDDCLTRYKLTAMPVRDVLIASIHMWARDPKSRNALRILPDEPVVDYPDMPELVVRPPDPDAQFDDWFALAQADLKRMWNERMQAYREVGWQTRAAKHGPEHFRAAVWHRVKGLKYDQIATRFWIPLQTVKEVVPEILRYCGFPARPRGRPRR
jgi:hypothetical protein